MFAVIKTGGKQYRVAADDILRVEKLEGAEGDIVNFDEVLLLGDGEQVTIGVPEIEAACVTGEIISQTRARKILVFKKKRRKNYRRTQGHRQPQTVIRITGISADGQPELSEDAPQTAAVTAAEHDIGAVSAPPAAVAEDVASAVETAVDAGRPVASEAAGATVDAPKQSEDSLFATPDAPGQDLKKISGIGPVLEKKLNNLGVTRFDQIAAFSAEDIEKIDASLNFKGRIEREDWIGQAAKLAAEDNSAG